MLKLRGLQESVQSAGLACGFGTFVLLGLLISTSGCNSNGFGLAGQNQSFGQQITYNTNVDMLFLVDNSSSMGPKEAQLSSGFQPFITYMVNSGFSFHVAVTTLDMSGAGASGNFVGSPNILGNGTSNLLSDFLTNVSQGTNGSDLGRGFQAMETALSSPLITGNNAGFLRSNALLALVFVSDTDDGSSGQPQDYINFLNTLKPPFPSGAMSWLANSIVVQSLTTACTTYDQFAAPGTRYMALSTASGGDIESICNSDLVAAAQNIGNIIVSVLTQYQLASAANPSTITVTINGVSIPQNSTNGWTYNSTTDTITFHGTAVPPAGADVQVGYQPVAVNH